MKSIRALAAATLVLIAVEALAEVGTLVGQVVTQKRGVVCVSDDFVVYSTAAKGADRCWSLDPGDAVGVVKSVDGRNAIVEFATQAGWRKYLITEKKEYYFIRDYWGDRLRIVQGSDSVVFDRLENGLLLSEGGGKDNLPLPIRVKFPLTCISLPPPRFGDQVVRGPDWNKGSADGEPGLMGVIIPRSDGDAMPRGRDGYVAVEWEATKRKGRYRWDYHRKFDVIPVQKK